MTRMRLAMGALGIVAVACGTAPPTFQGIDAHSHQADQLLLRVEFVGGGGCVGDVACDYQNAPELVILQDGTMISPRCCPAARSLMPFLQRRAPELIDEIHQAATEAGLLMDGEREPNPAAPRYAESTTFSVTYVDRTGVRHVVTAYGLEDYRGDRLEGGPSTPERDLLNRFRQRISALIERASQAETRSAPAARVTVVAWDDSVWGDCCARTTVEWPLDEPLASFGTAVADGDITRCGIVDGKDLFTIQRASDTRRGVAWRSEGDRYLLYIDPLMPTEDLTC